MTECPACRVTFPRASALLGAVPRLTPGIADSGRKLSTAETTKIRRVMADLTRKFPQLVVQIVLHSFPKEHPFSLHAFWLFNAGSFAGDSRRGANNHTVLLVIDPDRAESALMVGYGIESLISEDALDHFQELAGPAWELQRWGDGILRVLDGLDRWLESVADPIDQNALKGEF